MPLFVFKIFALGLLSESLERKKKPAVESEIVLVVNNGRKIQSNLLLQMLKYNIIQVSLQMGGKVELFQEVIIYKGYK